MLVCLSAVFRVLHIYIYITSHREPRYLFLDGEKDRKRDFTCLLSELFRCWSTGVKSFPQLCYCYINNRPALGDVKNFQETATLQMSKPRIASENTQTRLYGTFHISCFKTDAFGLLSNAEVLPTI